MRFPSPFPNHAHDVAEPSPYRHPRRSPHPPARSRLFEHPRAGLAVRGAFALLLTAAFVAVGAWSLAPSRTAVPLSLSDRSAEGLAVPRRAHAAANEGHAPNASGAADAFGAVRSTARTALAPDVVDPDAAMRSGSRIVWIPGLALAVGEASCLLAMNVQNLGHEPAKVVLISWGEAGACPPQANGPLKVECTGMIRPGGTWRLASAQIPVGTQSAAMVSFSTQQLSALDIDMGFDDVAADIMCETLFFGVVGDVDDYRRFLDAYRIGGNFAGIPQERVAGAPISVSVERDCPMPGEPERTRRSAFVGVLDAALGAPDPSGAYHIAVPSANAHPDPSMGTLLHVQNAGVACTELQIDFRVSGTSDDGSSGAPCPQSVLGVAPGESAQIDLSACAQAGVFDGSVIVRGTQPLAVTADLRSAQSIATLEGRPFGAGPVNGVTPPVETDLLAPSVIIDDEGWSSRVHVQNTDTTRSTTVRFTPQGRIWSGMSFTREVPALGSVVVDIGTEVAEDEPLMAKGGLRIESVADAGDGAGAPGIAAAVLTLRDTGSPEPAEIMGYTVAPAWSGAVSSRRVSARGGLLGVPVLMKTGISGGSTTEIFVANEAVTPGSTRFALMIFDSNGFLDFTCERLGAGDVMNFDFASWDTLNAGFRGSGVISATVWDHAAPEGGGAIAPMAQLSAVVTHRTRAASGDGTDAEPGDHSYAHPAMSIPTSAQARFEPGPFVTRFEVCGQTLGARTPTPWPTQIRPPTRVPDATRTPGARATPVPTQVFFSYLPLAYNEHAP